MSAASALPRLLRERDCHVAGVAGGLAEHLGWSVRVVRIAFVITGLVWGAGVLLYLWLWAFTPWRPVTDAGDEPVTRRAPVSWLLVAGAGLFALATMTLVWRGGSSAPEVALILLATVVCAAGAGAWASLIDRPDPARGRRTEQGVRAVASLTLLVVAVFFVSGTVTGVTGLVAALVALVGIGLVFAPALVRVWRDLEAERIGRIRDEQRNEMAAHLHDSVLQTLALIQNRAGASSEAGRLARAQERELRSWLYAGDTPADSDLATDLRDFAAALELDYPVHIDVVAVGASTERASGELAAAAREAMLNAARHAGGEVSVYIEGSTRAVEVFVRDRGTGFDLARVAADRLGVRQSIIGRMRRAGGSASVAPGAGGGTEVHLRFETEPARG